MYASILNNIIHNFTGVFLDKMNFLFEVYKEKFLFLASFIQQTPIELLLCC